MNTQDRTDRTPSAHDSSARAQHTPGPWKAELACRDIRGQESWRVNTPDGTVADYIDWAPDAPLIAAAPELLEACRKSLYALEGVVKLCEIHDSRLPDALLDLVRAAIAKAEGR